VSFDAIVFDLEGTLWSSGKIYPGVTEGIPKLAARYTLFLVSNCEPDYLEAFWKSSGLAAHFTDSECSGRTGRAKGANVAMVLARNAHPIAVMVGDTPTDQKAAAEAGLPFIHAAYGFGWCSGFIAAAKDFVSLTELLLAGNFEG